MKDKDKKESLNYDQKKTFYQTKKYKKSNINSHVVVTKKSAFNKITLTIFYLVAVLVIVVIFLMLWIDRYEFYIKKSEVTLGIGGRYQVELIPKDERYFDYLNYNYKVLDESVATVDEYGTITSVGNGETTLEVSLNPGLLNKKMKIISSNIEVNDIKIKKFNDGKYEDIKSVNISKDETITITTVINNDVNIRSSISCVSSNDNVVIIDNFGNITGKSKGTAVVACKKDGVSDTLTIKVGDSNSTEVITTPKPTVTPKVNPTPKVSPTPKPQTNVKVTKVILGTTETTKYVGETIKPSLKIEPSNAKTQNISWTSNNTKVATVDNNGLIKTIGKGTAIITVNIDGIKATCTIIVKEKATATPTPVAQVPKAITLANQITISTNSLTVNTGKTQTFTINATNAVGLIKVTSSNNRIATVKTSGGECNDKNECFIDVLKDKNEKVTYIVTGVGKGNATIDVYLQDLYTYEEKKLTGTGKISVSVK